MEKKYIEVNVHRAMIELPENAVEITVNAKVFTDGKLLEVSNVYDMAAVREMFRKADDGYIDDDDVFTITDKGREYLEGLKKRNE